MSVSQRDRCRACVIDIIFSSQRHTFYAAWCVHGMVHGDNEQCSEAVCGGRYHVSQHAGVSHLESDSGRLPQKRH